MIRRLLPFTLLLLSAAFLHAEKIVLVAGSGTAEKDAPATQCALHEPFCTEFLPTGEMVIAEMEHGNRVLKVGKDGVLHVTASAATCDDDVAHAACHLHQQDWGIPVRVVADGVDHLDLMLRGMAERTTT